MRLVDGSAVENYGSFLAVDDCVADDDGKKLPFGDGLPTYLLQESLGPALAPPLATPLATPLAPPLAPPMNFAKTLRIYRELSTNHNSLLIMVMVMVMESPTESPPQHRQRNRPRPRNCHNFDNFNLNEFCKKT